MTLQESWKIGAQIAKAQKLKRIKDNLRNSVQGIQTLHDKILELSVELEKSKGQQKAQQLVYGGEIVRLRNENRALWTKFRAISRLVDLITATISEPVVQDDRPPMS